MPTALPAVEGFSFATAAARLRDWERDDVAVVVAHRPAAVAGVFTQSSVTAAPVKRCRAFLAKTGGRARALVVNAGVANACTGRAGLADVDACARQVAAALDAAPEEILCASTGVIGRRLPMDKLRAGLDEALARATRDPAAGGLAKKNKKRDTLDAVARAIMTTDTRPKSSSVVMPGGAVVAGICKGSGMIAPNMATMLAFVFTDLAVEPAVLRAALTDAADLSFNNVTVDGDTSTNDTLLVFASGARGGRSLAHPRGKAYAAFRDALGAVALDLAGQIARDGEGATKMARVRVSGAVDEADARRAARTVAESPLVKTALFGNDPNWGRIVAALGRSGAKAVEEKIAISLCGVPMMRRGQPLPFDEKALSKKMRAREVEIAVSLGLGKGACTMLTCDFSYDYVKINADYTT